MTFGWPTPLGARVAQRMQAGAQSMPSLWVRACRELPSFAGQSVRPTVSEHLAARDTCCRADLLREPKGAKGWYGRPWLGAACPRATPGPRAGCVGPQVDGCARAPQGTASAAGSTGCAPKGTPAGHAVPAAAVGLAHQRSVARLPAACGPKGRPSQAAALRGSQGTQPFGTASASGRSHAKHALWAVGAGAGAKPDRLAAQGLPRPSGGRAQPVVRWHELWVRASTCPKGRVAAAGLPRGPRASAVITLRSRGPTVPVPALLLNGNSAGFQLPANDLRRRFAGRAWSWQARLTRKQTGRVPCGCAEPQDPSGINGSPCAAGWGGQRQRCPSAA